MIADKTDADAGQFDNILVLALLVDLVAVGLQLQLLYVVLEAQDEIILTDSFGCSLHVDVFG